MSNRHEGEGATMAAGHPAIQSRWVDLRLFFGGARRTMFLYARKIKSNNA